MASFKKTTTAREDLWDDSNTSAEDFFCLAELAQRELLKDKMKKILEVRQGARMDQIAALAVDAVIGFEDGASALDVSKKYKAGLLLALKC